MVSGKNCSQAFDFYIKHDFHSFKKMTDHLVLRMRSSLNLLELS